MKPWRQDATEGNGRMKCQIPGNVQKCQGEEGGKV